MIRTSYYLLFWMNFVADLLWLFRSFYLRHSSVESFVERDFFLLEFISISIDLFFLTSGEQSITFNFNRRQAQPVWRTKSYNFKREAWEGNAFFFFKYFLIIFFNYLAGVISLWLMAVPFILPTPLFRREFRRKIFFY
jgi:hypothetical protein